MEIQASLLKPPNSAQAAVAASISSATLLYNTCAILISYTYITRHLSISPISSLSPHSDRPGEFEEARRSVSRLVPFLLDRKSNVIFPTLSAAITDLWSRFEPGSMTSSFLALLLRDASHLLRPSAVVEVPSASSGDPPSIALENDSSPSLQLLPPHFLTSHASSGTILALSDVTSLFRSRSKTTLTDGAPGRASNHVTHKLAFYAARVMTTPSVALNAVADELLQKAKSVEHEGLEQIQQSTLSLASAPRAQNSSISEGKQHAGIQEVS